VPTWIDLVDPKQAELRDALPEHVHETAMEALLAPHEHDDEPRPRIESHGEYVLGILLLPVEVPHEDRLYYQEIDFVATMDVLVTVSKTPPGEKPFDPAPAKEACRPDEETGMYVYHLVDQVEVMLGDLLDEAVEVHPARLERVARLLRLARVERLLAGRRLGHRDQFVHRRDEVDLLVVETVFSGNLDGQKQDPKHVVPVRLDPRTRLVVVLVRCEERRQCGRVDVLGQRVL